MSIIHNKTGGLVLFVINFLRLLQNKGLVYFNLSLGRFEYNIEQIQVHATGDFEEVTRYLTQRMTRLNHKVQLALKVASCFRFKVDSDILHSAAVGLGIDQDLDEIVAMGYLQKVDASYIWSHDKVHQAAYSLIDNQKRKSFHLLVGSRLLLKTRPRDLDKNVFEIVWHMNIGAGLLKTQQQKQEVAELNLIAEEKAMKTSSFHPAAAYFQAAISLHGEVGDHDFLVRCYDLVMNPLYAIDDFGILENIIEKSLLRSQPFEEKLNAYQYLVRFLSASGKAEGKYEPID